MKFLLLYSDCSLLLLAVKFVDSFKFAGIYPEIAAAKHEYWSSFAPLPLEVVSSAGQKTKDDSWSTGKS